MGPAPTSDCHTFPLSIVEKSDRNLMTVSNLGVCFGPTLFRAEEETVAAIMDIKFTNVVVEIMISHWETLLRTKPDSHPPPKPAHSGNTPLQVSTIYTCEIAQLYALNLNPVVTIVTQVPPPSSSPLKTGSPPVVKPPPYIPPPPPSHNSPPTLVQVKRRVQ